MKVKSLSHVRPSATPGLQPSRLLCPWDFPGENTGMGCHFLLQGIFPTQGSNLLHLCTGRQILCHYATWEALMVALVKPCFAFTLCRASVFSSVLSHHNKDLERWTLKPSVRHSSRVLANRVIALRQVSVTALFYLEDSRRIHP